MLLAIIDKIFWCVPLNYEIDKLICITFNNPNNSLNTISVQNDIEHLFWLLRGDIMLNLE